MPEMTKEHLAKMQAARGKVERRKNPMPITALKSIRKYCVEMCCCGSSEEVKRCEIHKCNLFPYRFGKTPTKEDTDSHLKRRF